MQGHAQGKAPSQRWGKWRCRTHKKARAGVTRTRCTGPGQPVSATGTYTLRLSRSACATVAASTYSSSPPSGTPRAGRLTVSPRAVSTSLR